MEARPRDADGFGFREDKHGAEGGVEERLQLEDALHLLGVETGEEGAAEEGERA
ncbi:hypothetical protein LBMAG55_06000 [Verrucomicrobiota bacterium]|nr:hypothetical protein EMGBD4_08980 [Verrucomicrobiota bacterium]GDY17277.1 hypothetical protein LBMAG55_06000 [Verrucomicrobiota bacterium]